MSILSTIVSAKPSPCGGRYFLTCSLGHETEIGKAEYAKSQEAIEFPRFAMRPICGVCRCLEVLMPAKDPKADVAPSRVTV